MRRHLLVVLVVVLSVLAGATPVAAQDTITLTVSVVTEDGSPVAGATIDATWDGGSTTQTTASNGMAFVDVPAGADVELAVESDAYIRNTPVVIEDASEQDIEIVVAPKGTLTVETTDTDGPVEGVRVRLLQGGTTVVDENTNAQGRLTTDVIEQGEYTLRLFKSGYYRNVSRVTVEENASVAIEMRRGTVNVQFEVVDDHFSPPREVTDAEVSVSGIGSQRTTSGSVTFTLPVNSRYTVAATKDGYRSNETTIFVGTQESTTRLAINRERALTVTPSNDRVVVGETVAVIVRNAYNETVANATVLMNDEAVATTNANGRARVPVESAGNHTITARFEGVTSDGVAIEGVEAADEETETETPSPTETQTESPTETPEDGGGAPMPGFGPVAALVAVLAVAGLAALRRR